MPGRSTGGGFGGGRTTGPAATVCITADPSAKETEGLRACDKRPVTTSDESPVGAERAQTVAGISDGMMAVVGI